MVRVAQSEYLPTLSLVGNYTRFGDNPSVSGSDFKDAENWYVMGVASWNFWEWGRTKFRVDASRARENQALDAAKELNDQDCPGNQKRLSDFTGGRKTNCRLGKSDRAGRTKISALLKSDSRRG